MTPVGNRFGFAALVAALFLVASLAEQFFAQRMGLAIGAVVSAVLVFVVIATVPWKRVVRGA